MSHLVGHYKVVKKLPNHKIFGTELTIDKDTFKYHIYLLILSSILFKIFTIGFTIFFARSSIDYFDLRSYAVKSILISHGQLPYYNFFYEYPILGILPDLLSSIPALLFNNAVLLFTSFQSLMIIFDIGTAICVYLIALKIYNSKIALIAGLLYTLSCVAAYTTITRFDSFPVFLLMLSIVFILYNKKEGYILNGLGSFAKVFPIIVLPFELLYRGKLTSYKEEIIHVILIYVGMFILFIIPFIYLVGIDNALKPYLFVTGGTVNTIYANTFTFALYSWINMIFGPFNIQLSSYLIPLSSLVWNGLYGVMLIIIGIFLLSAYTSKEMKPIQLVTYICMSLCVLIICSKFHSPQYFMWVMPFFAILVADKIEKIIVFFIFNIFAYIEFPILFGSLYTNVQYLSNIGSYNWYMTLIFFTIEYIILFILMRMCSTSLIKDIKETIKYYLTNIYRW